MRWGFSIYTTYRLHPTAHQNTKGQSGIVVKSTAETRAASYPRPVRPVNAQYPGYHTSQA